MSHVNSLYSNYPKQDHKNRVQIFILAKLFLTIFKISLITLHVRYNHTNIVCSYLQLSNTKLNKTDTDVMT